MDVLLPILALLVGVVVTMIAVQGRRRGGMDGVRSVDATDPGFRLTELEREVQRLHDEVRRRRVPRARGRR